jgi:hypothetical protein
MNPDPDGPTRRSMGPDDEQLGALVRTLAEEWRLPPQRLDQPTWRDRVAARPGRRRGWFARLARPAVAAVVGTMVVAFAAVWLTAPRTDRAIVGASPSTSAAPSSAGASPPVESRRAASPLPALVHEGDIPDPAKVLVQANNDFQVADLATGTIGSFPIGRLTVGPKTMLARPGGGWVCICGDNVGSGEGRATGIDLLLESTDLAGAPGPRSTIREIRAEPDPALTIAEQALLVDVFASASPDGRVAFVTWTARAGAAGWTAGIDVIDLATAAVLSSTSLTIPDADGVQERQKTRPAPRIAVAPAGDAILVTGFWIAEGSSGPTMLAGTDHWSASFDGRAIGTVKPAGATAVERCEEFMSGLVDSTTYFALCRLPSGQFFVDRIGVDGKPVDRTEVPRIDGGLFRSIVTRQGDSLFLWDPVNARLTRFDLKSASVKSGTATAATPPATGLDALAALGRGLGRWMAPSVVAKVLLEPAMVVSPDGTRIYALGVDPPSGEDTVGSTGIYVFDADSLEPAGRWAPTADFASLAISPDGRYLYAAGQPGVDAAGNVSANEASITVYSTADGSINLIAGRLGTSMLLFPGTIAR